MCEKVLHSLDRVPAIDPEGLKLSTGDYANKHSLQLLALQSGFPVPEIIQYDEVVSTLDQGIKFLNSGKGTFIYDEKNRYTLFQRGFFPSAVDMWAVDSLPTTPISPEDDLESIEEQQKNIQDMEQVAEFLRINFEFTGISSASYFYQRSTPPGSYVSTWSRGGIIYSTTQFNQRNPGCPWFAMYPDGTVLESDYGIDLSYLSDLAHQLGPLVTDIKTVFDKELQKTLDYKHDFIYDHKGLHLIQSRVASSETTLMDQLSQNQKVQELLDSEIPQVQMEIGNLAYFDRLVPDSPFILNLHNFDHMGVASQEQLHYLDFHNVMGLILPPYLQNGLLQHHGYNLIAYALYWGIPIHIENY